jgi:hypothetical protein
MARGGHHRPLGGGRPILSDRPYDCDWVVIRPSPDALDEHADRVRAILGRGEEVAAAAIASERGLEATQ